MLFSLLLILMTDWNQEVAAIEETFQVSMLGTAYMTINDNVWNPTFFYCDGTRLIAEGTETGWVDKIAPLSLYSAAYDDQNRLAAVCKERYGEMPDDSTRLVFFPNIDDTVNRVALDSIDKFQGWSVSQLRFIDNIPVFVYGKNFYDSEIQRTTSMLSFVWGDEEGNWHIDLMDSASWGLGEQSLYRSWPILTIGYDNTPYVLYAQNYEEDDYMLKFAYKPDDVWVFETVNSSPGVSGLTHETFGIDKNGFAHIMHSYNYHVFYLTNSTGQWVMDTVCELFSFATTCWMSVFPDGTPVGMTSQINDAVELASYYYTQIDGEWQKERCPYGVWMELDRWGNVHLMGYDTTRLELPDTVFHYWLDTGIEEPATQPSSDLSLDIANPPTSSLRVSYSLPANQTGTISVFDQMGRRIQRQSVTGTGKLDLNTQLPFGVYIIRLESGGEAVSHKAVVLN